MPITTTTNPGGTYPGGNYAVFTGLSGATFTFTQTSENSNSGVMGIEIVDFGAPLDLANDVMVTNGFDDRRHRQRTPGTISGNLTIGANTLSITGGSSGAECRLCSRAWQPPAA